MAEFNISTNIIRDQNNDINYIWTKNAGENFDVIASNYKHNNKFQAIIGSYGTGKSSFLWALEQNLLGKKNFFSPVSKSYSNAKEFQFIKLIGQYQSLSTSLAKAFEIPVKEDNSESEALNYLGNLVRENSENKIVTVLIIDEFGKFLEYAVKNNPDKEVYFIQQLAEFFNDSKKMAFSIASLHQNFSTYGQSLSLEQFKEWEKVKGRLKEVAFNEPIDQLLYFAAERNEFKNRQLRNKDGKLFNLIKKFNISDKKRTIDRELAEKLLPIDYISAEIMAKSLQRYGQNERSLFSFLDINENYSFKWFYEKYKDLQKLTHVYSLNHVFDYIIEHYYFVISSNLNSDLTLWNSIKEALDQVDTRLDSRDIVDARKIVKSIGLLNIFTHAGSRIDTNFLKSYAELALGVKDAYSIIEELQSHKIISYKEFKHRYVFVSWTDLNIDFELQNASQKITEISNVAERVSELNDFHPILEKSQYFKTGTPRLFEYRFTDHPIDHVPLTSDALINYVFSDDSIQLNDSEEPILYAVFNNTAQIKSLFFEIDKANRVKQENFNDTSAVKELHERIFFHKQELKKILFDSIYQNDEIKWFWGSNALELSNRLDFNKILGTILNTYYDKVPILKNELVNRSKLSTPISAARRNLIQHLLDHRNEENIGFPNDKFPPEKTIYLSLLKNLGFHTLNEESQIFELGKPDFEENNSLINSYEYLWKLSEDFLNESKKGKKNVKDFIDVLQQPPLKLKQGFIDFWVPIFLIITKNDYALFNEAGYIPKVENRVFDVMFKSPQKFWIKAFDVTGIKLEVFNQYKSILNQKKTDLPSEDDFINTIKPFILFIRSLSEYSLSTENLSQESIKLRAAIKNAKDPEKAFFEDFPMALNYAEVVDQASTARLEGFVDKLNECISELRTSYPELLNRLESSILKTLGLKEGTKFENYKDIVVSRLRSIDASLLNSKLKNIHRRCIAPVNDKKHFLEGVAFAILGKTLNKIKDHEEQMLYKNFDSNYKHLLALVDIHALQKTHQNDLVFSVNILDKSGDESKHQIVIPADKIDSVQVKVNKINESFNGTDKDLKKAVLIELLNNEVNE